MEKFVDRYDELAVIRHLLNSLSKRETIQFPLREFIGIGGIGKSALLKQVVKECEQASLPCVYINVEQLISEPSTLFENIVAQTLEKAKVGDNTLDTTESVANFFVDFYGVIIFDSLNLAVGDVLSKLAEKLVFPLSELNHILILIGSRSRVDWGKPKYRLWRRTKSSMLLSFPLVQTSDQISPYSSLADEVQKITCGHPEANDIIVQILDKTQEFDVIGPERFKDYQSRLVDAVVDDAISGKIIPAKLNKPFSILSIFRYLNFDLPSEVLELIDKSTNWSDYINTVELFKQMQQGTDLVINSGSGDLGYRLDEFVRRALSLHMQLFFADDFLLITSKAIDYYQKKFYKNPSRVEFLVEKIFHYVDYLRLKLKDATDVDIARLVEKEFRKDIKPTIADPYYQISNGLTGLFRIEEPLELQLAVERLREILSQDFELNDKLGETEAENGQINGLLLRSLDDCWQESRRGLGVLEILKHFRPRTLDLAVREDEADTYDVLFRTTNEPIGTSESFEITPQARRGIGQDTKSAHTTEDLRQLGIGLMTQLPSRFHEFISKHSEPLILDVNDIEIPWELLHDGRDFLALRIPMGKRIRTVESPKTDRRNGEKILLVGVSQNSKHDLPALRFVESEISALVDLFEKNNFQFEVYMDDDADVWTVQKRIYSGDFKIIHFAGHTIQSRTETETGILMADGVLRKDTIRSIVRGNPLVFINTCQSAIGNTEFVDQIYRGGFMSSLVTDFIISGAKACVANLWDVRDDSAVDFATKFYKEAMTNVMIGEALRRAKNERYHLSSDRIWASYVLFGNPSEQLNFSSEG